MEAVITNLEAGDEALIVMLDTGEFEDGRKLNHTAVDAGLYRAKIVSVDNPNYTIEGAFNTVYDWEITKAVISGITMSDKTEVYNGQPQAIYVSGTTTQYGEVVDVAYYITPYGGQTSSGNSAVEVHIYEGQVSYYTVRAELTVEGDNYETMTLTARLTINKATISFEWYDLVSGISADNNPHIAVYNTYNHGKRFVVSGIYGEDKVILDISYSQGVESTYLDGYIGNYAYDFYSIDAGDYTVSITDQLGGEDAHNYKIAASSRVWIIQKKDIRILNDWFVGEWIYGGNQRSLLNSVCLRQNAQDNNGGI